VSNIAAEYIAGDTITWTDVLTDYPAPTWSAVMYFESEVGIFNAAAVSTLTSHVFTVSAATSAALKVGRYRYSLRVTSGSTVKTIETGWLEIRANPAASGAHDPRSDARQQLDALNAYLLGRATDGQMSMTINGRQLSRFSIKEAREWRDSLRAETKAEESGVNRSRGRYIKVSLNRG
jgi:hypothetical protein